MLLGLCEETVKESKWLSAGVPKLGQTQTADFLYFNRMSSPILYMILYVKDLDTVLVNNTHWAWIISCEADLCKYEAPQFPLTCKVCQILKWNCHIYELPSLAVSEVANFCAASGKYFVNMMIFPFHLLKLIW